MQLQLGDVLVMKKPHPCGSHRFTLTRVGMDLKLRCCGCGHEFMAPRAKIEKNVKQIEPKA